MTTFSSRIIKASALITDTRLLLQHWQPERTVSENLNRLREENPFGKASRSRLDDILPIFRRRYLADPAVANSLALLEQARFPQEALKQLLYYYTVRADGLLYAFVTEELRERYGRGRRDLPTDEVVALLQEWVDAKRTTALWGRETIERVAQGLLATLRDFDVLSGAVHKRLNPRPLTLPAFTFLAFDLMRTPLSGAQVLAHPNWRIFFLEPNAVERLFINGDQAGLLSYAAAGAVIRVHFPADSLEGYARCLAHARHESLS